jgi:hypothetical protein
MAINFKELMLAKIRAAAPDLDTTFTSIFYELCVRPFLSFLSVIESLIDRDAIARDIRRYAEMTDQELEALAANFFVFRKSGTPSVGTVTVFYDTPQDVVIPIGQTFTSKSGASFVSTETISLSKNQLSLKYDRTEDAYRVDVPGVKSVGTGDGYNIGIGEIVQISSQTENIKFITNYSPFSKSVAKEENSEFAARIKNSASMRNLCSADSAAALLSDDDRVSAVSTIGAGDPEMIRDIKYGTHVNGMQDTYIYASEPPSVSLFEKAIDNPTALPTFYFNGSDLSAVFTGSIPEYNPSNPGPVIYVSSVEYGTGFGTAFSKVGDLAFPEDYAMAFAGDGVKEEKNSTKELWKLQIVKNPDTERTDLVVRVTAYVMPLISNIQAEFKESNKRSAAHTTLFKNFTPAVLDVSVVVKPNPSASRDPSYYENIISSLILANPIAASIDGSDIITALENGGADRVEIPISATARVMYPDLSVLTASFQNNIQLKDLENPDIGVTIRVMALYVGDISVQVI